MDRRLDDKFLGRILKSWHLIVGVSGIIFTLGIIYHSITLAEERINILCSKVEENSKQITSIDKIIAVSDERYSEIIRRLELIDRRMSKLHNGGQ